MARESTKQGDSAQMDQLNWPPFRSAVELDHDNSLQRRQSNALISNNNNNISSCDSINLEPLDRGQFNQRKTKNIELIDSLSSECLPSETDSEQSRSRSRSSMKIRRSSKKVKKQPSAKRRPHFRIDWRQLSYYQRPHSFLSKCLASLDLFSPSNSKTLDKQVKLDERSEASSLMSAPNPVAECGSEAGDNNRPRQILNSLDGYFKSGELSAILGPSGAGKSTFLSTLFGSKQDSAFGYTKVTWLNDEPTTTTTTDSAGLVTTTVNDESDQTLNDDRHRSLRIAFLPQHDHLLHHLTVYETLMFASRMKNHENRREKAGDDGDSQEGRKNFHHMNVKRVAKMLKLTDCLNTRCGKLSGGQYKRVSIGQELLSEPDVIILDEPTSGLDAMTCLTTVQTLKSIVTKHPMSIILTIHQPDQDVFRLFDKVYVIAQGGMAIYEGPPEGIFPTLAEVNLIPPRANYNPARFVVENAFVPEPAGVDQPLIGPVFTGGRDEEVVLSSSDDNDDDDDDSDVDSCPKDKSPGEYFKRSVQSLTDTILGKETPFVHRASPRFNKRETVRRPLLNIGGVRTLDGQLISSHQLGADMNKKQDTAFSRQQWEKLELLRRLNRIQKARYEPNDTSAAAAPIDTLLSGKHLLQQQVSESSGRVSPATLPSSPSPNSSSAASSKRDQSCSSSSSSSSNNDSAKSDYSSASACSMTMINTGTGSEQQPSRVGSATTYQAATTKSVSLACLAPAAASGSGSATTKQTNSLEAGLLHVDTGRRSEPDGCTSRESKSRNQFVVDFGVDISADHLCSPAPSVRKLRRKFDKRLSAKHNCSQQTGYPIFYHAMLLTHRTWLSIVRDPIFFGIQACMHTLIPIVLATIFGSVQEEGCPRIGNFDLVDFAYSDSENLIQGTVRSIRQSIGNIGIMFFEMFVICFAINCITALVFPLDMFVLLKEYRNGWYSLRSYFMGRTLADLPVPVVLHSIGVAILYFMTAQPSSLWRFTSIVLLVVLASLVAQSVGLTIGALLMKSSQSAVLAAAGIVAPFFALSGFIVRIHTLPLLAQVAANMSYLYHLLNGFIILRYGFGRCPCSEEDFEQNSAHQIPSNLHTMASMWIGTYSDEYTNSSSVLRASTNNSRSNVDPNIDVIDKMMTAFKMANSYGHQIDDCQDVLPYAMLDFNQRDQDIYYCFYALAIMLLVTRLITFSAIYYKIRSFA